MPLRRFRRQYEQLSQFERGRIIGMMEAGWSARQCSASHVKGVTRLSPHFYYPSLACRIPRIVSNRPYLGSFGTMSWTSNEFDRTRGKVTSNMERNVSRYRTKLVCLNVRSCRLGHLR
ncbi:transposable element Tcb1 transposase [Trichonephila clavipes]|nr:transposable element Tcb1 transposase [Trichonephila clavipes]